MNKKKIVGGTGITAGRDVTLGDVRGTITFGENITQISSPLDKKELLDSLLGFQKEKAKQLEEAQNLYLAYVSGFIFAKIAWSYDDELEKRRLTSQFKEYFKQLSINPVLLDSLLDNFTAASSLESLSQNVQLGNKKGQEISNILKEKYGKKVAAGYRFGFNLINIMPYLEFAGKATPSEQLLNQIKNNFNYLVHDGEIISLDESYLQIFRNGYDKIFLIGADKVRELLNNIGLEIEQKLMV